MQPNLMGKNTQMISIQNVCDYSAFRRINKYFCCSSNDLVQAYYVSVVNLAGRMLSDLYVVLGWIYAAF